MIGKLRSVVLDARDPVGLAEFYGGVLGGTVQHRDDTWSVVTDAQGRRFACQLSPEHEPPLFPDPRGSQQFHLDIEVDDIEIAEREVLALGADKGDGRPRRGSVPGVPRPGGTHVLPGVGHHAGGCLTGL